MRRDDFLGWLEARLGECDVPVRRWTVSPGLEDLEVQDRGGNKVRLRIVRTPPNGGEPPADRPPVTRPEGVGIERRSSAPVAPQR
ncbi:MAG: hypothetical protein KDI56_09450 [Xanthomonadales bacterium]|nr:hypothetical protein [Xanthomonadales bacterium]